jgi:hypothetical protein
MAGPVPLRGSRHLVPRAWTLDLVTMQADAALYDMSLPRVAFFCTVQLAIVLAVAWIGTRSHPADFRFRRVIGLSLFCLATSLPFVWLAYVLWPWDFQSWLVRADILLAVFMPLVVAFILGIVRKRKLSRK